MVFAFHLCIYVCLFCREDSFVGLTRRRTRQLTTDGIVTIISRCATTFYRRTRPALSSSTIHQWRHISVTSLPTNSNSNHTNNIRWWRMMMAICYITNCNNSNNSRRPIATTLPSTFYLWVTTRTTTTTDTKWTTTTLRQRPTKPPPSVSSRVNKGRKNLYFKNNVVNNGGWGAYHRT